MFINTLRVQAVFGILRVRSVFSFGTNRLFPGMAAAQVHNANAAVEQYGPITVYRAFEKATAALRVSEKRAARLAKAHKQLKEKRRRSGRPSSTSRRRRRREESFSRWKERF